MIKAEYVIVGAGLTGATIARTLQDAGRDVLIIEARDRVGGNVVDVLHPSGIRHCSHGPHYFRTSSPRIQEYAERFATFYPFSAVVMSSVGAELFPWPIHRGDFERLAGGMTPEPAPSAEALDFERLMLTLVPRPIYETFIRGYNLKQWGVDPALLDASLARRIEVRDDGDLRLSTATFQALPLGGFSAWVERMLEGISVRTSTDFHDVRDEVSWGRALVYTGPIDRFFDYRFGPLAYRTQQRIDVFIPGETVLFPCGQINLPSATEGKHIRTIEWRHMLAPGEGPEDGTLLTFEVPGNCTNWGDAEYPFPSSAAQAHYQRYAALARDLEDVLICGRLGEYRYLDMDQAIARAMTLAKRLLDRRI